MSVAQLAVRGPDRGDGRPGRAGSSTPDRRRSRTRRRRRSPCAARAASRRGTDLPTLSGRGADGAPARSRRGARPRMPTATMTESRHERLSTAAAPAASSTAPWAARSPFDLSADHATMRPHASMHRLWGRPPSRAASRARGRSPLRRPPRRRATAGRAARSTTRRPVQAASESVSVRSEATTPPTNTTVAQDQSARAATPTHDAYARAPVIGQQDRPRQSTAAPAAAAARPAP